MSAKLKVLCGVCWHKLRLPDKPGRQFLCPNCQATLVIPTRDEVAAAKPDRFAVQPIKGPKKGFVAAPRPQRKMGKITEQVLADMTHDGETPSLDDLCDGPAIEY